MRGPARSRTARRASDHSLGPSPFISFPCSVLSTTRYPGYRWEQSIRVVSKWSPREIISSKTPSNWVPKGLQHASRLRLVLKKTNLLQTLHLPCYPKVVGFSRTSGAIKTTQILVEKKTKTRQQSLPPCEPSHPVMFRRMNGAGQASG